MIYSSDGLHLTEGFEGCKLAAYQDQVGVWTIGYGHTRGVVAGLTCTQEEAETWLQEDVQRVADAINRDVKIRLSQPEFDALVDFGFNLGVHALEGSTLWRKLNAGDFDGAAAEFPKWDMAGGHHVVGLLRRRLGEQSLFNQRGNMDLWAVLGILMAVALIGWGIKVWWHDHIEGVREEGRAEVRNTVLAERNKQLVAVQGQLLKLQAEKEAQEKAHATTVAEIDRKGQNELAQSNAKRTRLLDDLIAGRVRIPGVNWAASTGSGICAKGAPAGSPRLGNEEAAGNIPAGFGGFLVAQAKRADETAIQLGACQQIVIDDRKDQ